MRLYFVYFHFSRKSDIFWIFVLYFSIFYCSLGVFVFYCPVFPQILYCIPVLLKKKIAVGGLQESIFQIKMLWFNWITGFSDHQYLQKESIDLLYFLQNNSHKKTK